MGTKEERAEYLREILVGQGGLVSTAEDMKNKTDALIKKLADFDGQITDANKQLQTYTGQQSQILTLANQNVGSIKTTIEQLRREADAAEKTWKDYTIAAVTTSIGITVLSGGLLWFVGAAAGIGLGIKADTQKAKYNALIGEIGTQNVELSKKSRLVTDLTGLNTQIGNVAPALADFKNQLQQIQGVWVGVSGNLQYIATNYGVDQLSSLPWITQAMKIGDATKKWQEIGRTTEQFITHSLVSYNQDTTWGQQIA
ncbi:MAG: hypothetical protein MK289_23930 [Trichodesmium sp. ALOHA_ZT_67]|nr:hypothetical protein [Trichodesmium sp. ALOHA_ZT_67]